jgi:hypothetical protein
LTVQTLSNITLDRSTPVTPQLSHLVSIIYGHIVISYNSILPKQVLKTLSPMGTICDENDIVEARSVTGEVLHVDSGAHTGKW